jgi:predicted ATPase
MRVDRLYLKNFKNLINFEVDFDVSSSRQVIVGRNGVGKSNLMEALAWIFRELDLEETPKFAYEIEYHCNGHFVKIISEEQTKKGKEGEIKYKRIYSILTDQGEHTDTQQARDYQQIKELDFYKRNRPINKEINPGRLLPLYVFGYYSGVSERFNEVFSKHEEIYYREQITGEEAPLRPLFLAKPHHSQFALLSFFASHDEPAQEFLRNEFNIEKLESVLFSLHEPYWKRSRLKKKVSKEIDERFWQAGGKVEGFLDSLYQHALAPMSGKQRKKVSIGRKGNLERRFCYIKDEETLRSMSEGLNPKEFFARLESTIFSDLVSTDGEDVRIKVRLTDLKKPITFKELSEGEQQLLTIIGLMRFTAQNESLFLLDEPDTYLNPAWCLDYLDNLRKYGVEPLDSQIIMTTHNPLTFAGLEKNEVVIMERGRDNQIYSQHPFHAPKGMGFQAILTSDFFGLRSTLDRDTLEKLDRKRFLSLKDERTKGEDEELSSLNLQLGSLDFAKATRDPLYLEFIRAMTKAQEENPDIRSAIPVKADWKLRKQIATDIAKKLKEKNTID